jgi:hypothetical protein
VGKGITSSTDLSNTRLPWADITTVIPGCEQRSGAAVFVPPSHPDYPPTWLTRHYGPLCIGWPGVESKTFEPGKPFSLAYRILVHKSQLDLEQLERAYAAFAAATQANWKQTKQDDNPS